MEIVMLTPESLCDWRTWRCWQYCSSQPSTSAASTLLLSLPPGIGPGWRKLPQVSHTWFPHPVADWHRCVKSWAPLFNCGKFWRVIPASELPQRVSWGLYWACTTAKSFLCQIPLPSLPPTSPVHYPLLRVFPGETDLQQRAILETLYPPTKKNWIKNIKNSWKTVN